MKEEKMFKIIRTADYTTSIQKNFYDSVQKFKKSYKQFVNEANVINKNHSLYHKKDLNPHNVTAYELKPKDLLNVHWVELNENDIKGL